MFMSEKRKIVHAILLPLMFLFLMWVFYLAFWFLDIDMSIIGIYPQSLKGVIGIILSPFGHGGISHISSNSVSFLLLSIGLFYFYRLIAYRVFFINWAISGLLLWIGGRESIHIGASGIVYGLAFFLFFSGVMRRDQRLGAVSMIVIFLYGSMFWGMLPQGGNISWEGHLFGAMSGFALAWYYRKNPVDFKPEVDGSSVSITWGNYNNLEYEYTEDDEDSDSTSEEKPFSI